MREIRHRTYVRTISQLQSRALKWITFSVWHDTDRLFLLAMGCETSMLLSCTLCEPVSLCTPFTVPLIYCSWYFPARKSWEHLNRLIRLGEVYAVAVDVPVSGRSGCNNNSSGVIYNRREWKWRKVSFGFCHLANLLQVAGLLSSVDAGAIVASFVLHIFFPSSLWPHRPIFLIRMT